MNSDELGTKVGQVVAKALADDAFRQKLLSDPAAALKEQGVELPDGLELRVAQNPENLLFIGLPTCSLRALSDEELGDVAGGEPAHTLVFNRLRILDGNLVDTLVRRRGPLV